MGPYHPECPDRLGAIKERMVADGLDSCLAHYEAPLAQMEQIQRAHSRSYIEMVENTSPQMGLEYLDPDTAMNPFTWIAALRSAGAGVLATDLVMKGEADSAFCSVRPPGHHAERARAMGFCIFNNIAIAVLHGIAAWGLKRVAIVDFDVHHGNGTEDIFSGNEQVLMVSTFQHPYYPFSGTENPAANMCNVPLRAGTGSEGFRQAVSDIWLPRLREFAPEMVFFSAGFDAHQEDEMASLKLVEADYAWVTQQIKDVTAQSAQGRMVSMLEGGYKLPALGRSVSAHIKALAGL